MHNYEMDLNWSKSNFLGAYLSRLAIGFGTSITSVEFEGGFILRLARHTEISCILKMQLLFIGALYILK